jgi:hypothetical protein
VSTAAVAAFARLGELELYYETQGTCATWPRRVRGFAAGAGWIHDTSADLVRAL